MITTIGNALIYVEEEDVFENEDQNITNDMSNIGIEIDDIEDGDNDDE